MYLITAFIGLVAAAAPFLFNYTDPVLYWGSIGFGLVVFGLSVLEGFRSQDRWEYAVIIFLGIGAVVAPFVMKFTQVTEALWLSLTLGVIALAVGSYEIFIDREQV